MNIHRGEVEYEGERCLEKIKRQEWSWVCKVTESMTKCNIIKMENKNEKIMAKVYTKCNVTSLRFVGPNGVTDSLKLMS